MHMRRLFYNSLIITFSTLIGAAYLSGCKKDIVTPENTFPATEVFSLYSDPDGTLWAGTVEGLVSFRDNQWKIHNEIPGIPSGNILDIAYQFINDEHELWFGSPSGLSVAAYELDAVSSATTYMEEPGKLPDNNVLAVAVDAVQARWAATPAGLGIFHGDAWYQEDKFGDLVQYPVQTLGSGEEGWIFAGTRGKGVGRFRYDETIDGISGASFYDKAWSGLRSDTILAVCIIRNDEQWFGTTRGVSHHTSWETKKEWESFDTSDGLIHNHVQCIDKGKDGKLWFGTPEGASSFDGESWITYGTTDGLVHKAVNDIAIDSKGLIWFATPLGISSFDGSQWTSYKKN